MLERMRARVVAEDLIAPSPPVPRRFALRQVAVLLITALVVVVMLLTSGQMSDLRIALPPLSQALNWLDRMPVPLDMYHVAFFTLIALATRLLLPRVPWWWVLLGLCGLALVTELLQFWTIGRTPSLLDARDDAVGAVLGILLGSVLLRLGRYTGGQIAASHVLVLAGVALLPLQLWSPFRALGFQVLLADVAFVAALSLRGLAWLGGKAPVRVTAFHVWIGGYVLSMLLAVFVLWPAEAEPGTSRLSSAMNTPAFLQGLGGWVRVLWLAVLAMLTCEMAGHAGGQRRLVSAWLGGATVAAMAAWIAVFGFYAGDAARETVWPLLSHYGSLPPGPYPRVRGIFANANMFGLYLLLSVGVAIAARNAAMMSGREFRLFLLLVSIPLLATASPSFAATALLVALWWRMQPGQPSVVRNAAVIFTAFMTIANAILLLVNPAAPLADPSVRLQLWTQGMSTWMNHFWRGSGLEHPPAQVHYQAPDGSSQYLTDAHNIVLNLGAQGGVLAVIAFFGLVAWLLLSSRRVVQARGLSLAILLAVAYLGIGGSFEDARVLWVAMGLLAGVSLACACQTLPRACADAARETH